MRLGDRQKEVLDALCRHKKWYRGCGWVWDTHSYTERQLRSMVKHELVEVQEKGFTPVFTPTWKAIGMWQGGEL